MPVLLMIVAVFLMLSLGVGQTSETSDAHTGHTPAESGVSRVTEEKDHPSLGDYGAPMSRFRHSPPKSGL